MADDPGQIKSEEQAQSAVPTDDKGQDKANPQDGVQETGETFEEPAGESGKELPKEVSERTREQFEKLKSQLREARQKAFSQESQRTEYKPLLTPEGLVDVDALTDLQKRAYEAEKRSRELEQRFTQKSQDDQARELYSAHPELKNPASKEAKDLFDESERIWMHSQAFPEKYGGESLSQKQAADLAKRKMGNSGTAKEETVKLEEKEEASYGVTGKPTQGVQSKILNEEEQKMLSYGTRIGDKDSMVARMRSIREANQPK